MKNFRFNRCFGLDNYCRISELERSNFHFMCFGFDTYNTAQLLLGKFFHCHPKIYIILLYFTTNAINRE